MYLTERHFKAIERWWPTYRAAADLIGFTDSLILVPLHYMESDCGDKGDAGTIEGPFGCDQGKDDLTRGYAGRMKAQFHLPGGDSLDENHLLAAVCCAYELRAKIRYASAATVQNDLNALADAYFGYNGRSPHYCEALQTGKEGADHTTDWRWSPYVANDPEKGFMLNTFSYTSPKADGSRTLVNHPSRRPGAIIIWQELGVRRSGLKL